jgi:hypothetical protein
MAQKIAGTAYLFVAGRPVALRGNFVVSPTAVERTMLAGQDGIHGYQELPRVPFIEGDISTMPNVPLATFERDTDIKVTAQLANGFQYQLAGATCKAGYENNTREGQCRIRWEGILCIESTWSAVGAGA